MNILKHWKLNKPGNDLKTSSRMPLNRIKLRISAPTKLNRLSRGFYQIEEEKLYVQIGQFAKTGQYFSYLESKNCRLEIDRHGYLIFIVITTPRRNWNIMNNLDIPSPASERDVKFIPFRKTIKPPQIQTTPDQKDLKICFFESTETICLKLNDYIMIEVNSSDELAAIWIINILDDLAGKKLASFRKKHMSDK